MHEAEFPASVSIPATTGDQTLEALSLLNLGKVDAIKIKSHIRHRGARASDLAKIFNVPVAEIRKIIDDPDNGLSDADRGWVKLAEDH